MLLEASVWVSKTDHVNLKLSIPSSALPPIAAVWLAYWNSEYLCGFKIEYTQLGFASLSSAQTWLLEIWPNGLNLRIRSLTSSRLAAVSLGFWNSDLVVLKSSIYSSAPPRQAAVWLGFWNSDHVVLKLSIRSAASPRLAAVWPRFWNSDHVVLKSSIRSSALPCLAAVWLCFWNSKHDETQKCDGPLPYGWTDLNVEIVM